MPEIFQDPRQGNRFGWGNEKHWFYSSLSEQSLKQQLQQWKEKLPPYKGTRAIDYTYARETAGLWAYVVCGNELLLVKRGPNVMCPNTWNVLKGFIDEVCDDPIGETFRKEMEEELCIGFEQLSCWGSFDSFIWDLNGRDDHIFPVIAFCSSKPIIQIDNDENTDYSWIPINQIYSWLPRIEADWFLQHYYG